MTNKYLIDDYVYARKNPFLKLIICRIIKKIYYCKINNDENSKEKFYFEEELMNEFNSLDEVIQ